MTLANKAERRISIPFWPKQTANVPKSNIYENTLTTTKQMLSNYRPVKQEHPRLKATLKIESPNDTLQTIAFLGSVVANQCPT